MKIIKIEQMIREVCDLSGGDVFEFNGRTFMKGFGGLYLELGDKFKVWEMVDDGGELMLAGMDAPQYMRELPEYMHESFDISTKVRMMRSKITVTPWFEDEEPENPSSNISSPEITD